MFLLYQMIQVKLAFVLGIVIVMFLHKELIQIVQTLGAVPHLWDVGGFY